MVEGVYSNTFQGCGTSGFMLKRILVASDPELPLDFGQFRIGPARPVVLVFASDLFV
ncbi:MAG: hypothetical protein O3A00_19815 [Planctomycetota bacterium]|nr:hypothetical protein [Planctomycetota bacterium]